MSENSRDFKPENSRICIRLALLRPLDPHARIAALSQALGIATDAEIPAIAAELLAASIAPSTPQLTGSPLRNWLSRRRLPASRALADNALATIAANWPRLPPDIRATALLVGRGRWTPIVQSMAAADPAARTVAATIIRDTADPRLAPLAAALLSAPGPLAELGDQALFAMAAAASAAPQHAEPLTADEAAQFSLTLAGVVRAFPDHRRPSVFLAASVLLTPARLARANKRDTLAQWFEESDHASHMGFRTFVRHDPHPSIRARAFEWLGARTDTVAAAALDRLSHAPTVDDHESVLPRTHLLANPRRARRIALIRSRAPRAGRSAPSAIIPGPDTLPRLSTAARRGLPRLVSTLRMDDDARAVALAPFAADADPLARLAAIRTAPPALLPAFLTDANPRLAVAAALRAAAIPAPADEFDARDPRARIAARRALAADRDAFLARLRARLADPVPGGRTGVLMLARRLNLQPALELELLTLASQPDDEPLAATAIAALAEIDSPSAGQAVRAILDHGAGRARANALEGAARRLGRADPATADPALYTRLIELKDDPHQRTRANAIRALLAARPTPGGAPIEPAALDSLAAMLADSRPGHRLSGLWLAERALCTGVVRSRRWSELASRLAELARTESHPDVRARAVRAAARLIAEVRSGWRDRALAIEGSTP